MQWRVCGWLCVSFWINCSDGAGVSDWPILAGGRSRVHQLQWRPVRQHGWNDDGDVQWPMQRWVRLPYRLDDIHGAAMPSRSILSAWCSSVP